MTAGEEPAEIRSTISGGVFFGPALLGRDIQATFQLPTEPPAALAQLPPVTAGFTGRDEQLAALVGLLDPGGTADPVPVLVVTGLPGVGKTTLAVQAGYAGLARGWFRGGVLFVDLHGYDEAPVEPGQALDALLRALGVAAEYIPPTAEERAGMYRSVLAQARDRVLVIVDNASTEAQVRPLLPGTGPHKVLVTSRYTMAGLTARLVEVVVLAERAALDLLNVELQAARPGDDRIAGDPEAASRLAALCGGLPLALQIATALLKADQTLTAAELADDLAAEHDRLQRLVFDRGEGASGSSVAAAFELSCRRLDDTQARVFRLLPVSPGPDISTATAAVLADLSADQVRSVLACLVRAHLAEVVPGAKGRWRMHDLLRLYAQQLSGAPTAAAERQPAVSRLLRYYLDMADAADDHLRAVPGTPLPDQFTDRDDALKWLDAERACLVAAVTMAAETGRDEAAMRLPDLLGRYFDGRRRFDDWTATATIGLAAARRAGNRLGEGYALNNLGLARYRARQFDQAITDLTGAVDIFRETGDRPAEGSGLSNIGLALQETRRFDDAVVICQNAAAIFHETGDRRGEGDALNNLAGALQGMRRFEEAINVLEDAAQVYRASGDPLSEGQTLGNLGLALQEAGSLDDAIAALTAALATFRETGDRHGEGTVLLNLGIAQHAAGQSAAAITALTSAAVVFEETGDRHAEGRQRYNLTGVLWGMGRFDDALAAGQEAVDIFRETGDRHGEGEALGNLGGALLALDRIEDALAACREAVDIFRESGDQHGEAVALDNLGVVLREAGRFEQAIRNHQAALAILRVTGDQPAESNARNNLERAKAARRGDPAPWLIS